MPTAAKTEKLEINGRELNLHWKSPRFGEWLAWCYVPAASLSPHEGVGFEARAETEEGAREAVIRQVTSHLQASSGEGATG